MSTNLKTVPCRGCGKPIVFAENTQTGKMIPLDARSVCYVAQEWEGKIICASSEAMISHFATCPKAADFSHKKEKT